MRDGHVTNVPGRGVAVRLHGWGHGCSFGMGLGRSRDRIQEMQLAERGRRGEEERSEGRQELCHGQQLRLAWVQRVSLRGGAACSGSAECRHSCEHNISDATSGAQQ